MRSEFLRILMDESIQQCYKILGIEPGASPAAVKRAYRLLAKTWHPDRFANDPQRQQQAAERFKQINHAYKQLKLAVEGPTTATARTGVSRQRLDPEACYNRGVEEAKEGQYLDAIESFTQAIRANPDYIKAYQYRGFLNEKLGYEHQANADFQKVSLLKRQAGTTASTSAKASDTPSSTVASTQWACRRTLMGHTDAVSAIAIAPDNTLLISGSYDKNIKLWQLNVGQAISSLRGHTDQIHGLAISWEGAVLASASADKTIRLWDLTRRKIICTLGGFFAGHSEAVLAVAICRNREILISGGADRIVRLWNWRKGREIHTLTGYISPVSSLAIQPDGETFITGDGPSRLRVRQTYDGKLVQSFKTTTLISSLAFNPGGRAIAIGGMDGTVELREATTGELIRALTGHTDRVSAVVFSPDRETLATSSWDRTIKLWQVDTGREIGSLEEHNDWVLSLAFSNNGETLVSGDASGTIKVWQPQHRA